MSLLRDYVRKLVIHVKECCPEERHKRQSASSQEENKQRLYMKMADTSESTRIRSSLFLPGPFLAENIDSLLQPLLFLMAMKKRIWTAV